MVPRLLRPATALGGLYVVALALIGLWPRTVDDGVDVAGLAPVQWMSEVLGLTDLQGYEVVQVAANVVLFVPFGALVLLLRPPTPVWLATLTGAAASALVELLQHWMRPERFGSVQDIVANSIGAALGAGAVWLTRHRRRRPPVGGEMATS